MALIEHINGPADLKKLNPSQLPEVAAELRRKIIDTIAENGGHFGGPLGAVELCVALHYLLDSPKDKIVWDVGYQAYAHKILTGRRDNFHTLRQWQGVAPFPRIRTKDLQHLGQNRNISEAIRRQAIRLSQARSGE